MKIKNTRSSGGSLDGKGRLRHAGGVMRRVFLAMLFLFPAFGGAALGAEGLSPGPGVRVADVVDGDTVVLEAPVDGARHVRLVGIQAPKIALGRKGFKPWPLGGQAKAALERLVGGRRVALSFGGRRMDRHGRLLAHLHDEGGLWVQGELLRLGLARVYSFPDNRARVPEMLALERTARKAGRGIWGLGFYAVRPVEGLGRHIGTFQVIEGRVLAAAKVKGRVYLNFGADWRTDFTVSLDSRARRLFRKNNVPALELEGKRVRVRGWLRKRNGPLIEATHPEQVEILD